MMRSLYSAVSGLKTHQTRMDVIGNNIANVNTEAFKSSRVTFSEIMYQTTSQASGGNAATGVGGINAKQIGLGVATGATSISITTAGAAETTGNPFDLKLTDSQTTNFFVVSDGTNTFFTRSGSYYVDGNGFLCMTSTGYTLMGWQVDPTTGVIKKDTVSPLQVMSAKNQTSSPEATTKAQVSGILDKNDANLKSSEDGYVMTLNFYDDLGYSYTARFSVAPKGTGEGDDLGRYNVRLTDVLDQYGASVIDKANATLNADSPITTDSLFSTGEYSVRVDAEGNPVLVNTGVDAAGNALTNIPFTVTRDGAGNVTGLSYDTASLDLNGDGTVGNDKLYYYMGADGNPVITYAQTNADGTVNTEVGVVPAKYYYDPATNGVTADGTVAGAVAIDNAAALYYYTDGNGNVVLSSTPTVTLTDNTDPNNPVTTIVTCTSIHEASAPLRFKTDANGNVTLSTDAADPILAEAKDYTAMGKIGAMLDANNELNVYADTVDVGVLNVSQPVLVNIYKDIKGNELSPIQVTVTEDAQGNATGLTVAPTAIDSADGSAQPVYYYLDENGNTVLTNKSKDEDTSEPYTLLGDPNASPEEIQNQIKMLDVADNNLYYYTKTTEVNGKMVTTSYLSERSMVQHELVFDTNEGNFISINGEDSVTLRMSQILSNTENLAEGRLSNFMDVEVDFTSCLNLNNGGTSTMGALKGIDGDGAGKKLGALTGLSVDASGRVYGSYDNGNTVLLCQVAVAQFSNASGLEKVGDNCYQTTLNSGDFDGIGVEITADGSSISTGELEMSNVDLSAQFTDMIITQRGFQANSRVITTSDSLLEELINLKR